MTSTDHTYTIHPYMPHAEYAARDGINATAIKAGTKSPLHMHAVMTGRPRTDTPAMRWGRLVHLVLLEPERAESLTVWQGQRRGKAWDGYLADGGDPDMIVTAAEMQALDDIEHRVLRESPHACEVIRMLHESRHEAVVTWRDHIYGAGKARIDMVSDQYVADIKTVSDITAFQRQAYRMGYDLQMAWYAMAVNVRQARIIAIESKPPYDVALYTIPPAVLDAARERAVAIAREYRVHESIGKYPGVTGGEVLELTPPAWYGSDGNCELVIEGESVEL